MKKVEPYKTFAGALQALDNGGRLYNLLSRAGDGEIDEAELARAAGFMTWNWQALFFFELAVHRLTRDEQDKLRVRMHPKLRKRMSESRPGVIGRDMDVSRYEADMAAIARGYPQVLGPKTRFAGSGRFESSRDGHVIHEWRPLQDEGLDVWRLYANPSRRGPYLIVGTRRAPAVQPGREYVLCGLTQPLKFPVQSKPGHENFLMPECYSIG